MGRNKYYPTISEISVEARYFWRWFFAYIADLAMAAIAITVIVVALNQVSPIPIQAPSFISSTVCEIRTDIYSTEEMNRRLPLTAGQRHQTILCKQTNMFVTSFYTTRLERIEQDGNRSYVTFIELTTDQLGNQTLTITSNPLLYIIAPFAFAAFLRNIGRTPGKALLGLSVETPAGNKPSFATALKREAVKAIPLIIISVIELTTFLWTAFAGVNGLVQLADDFADTQVQPFLLTWLAVAVLGSLAAFWFYFGSFIRWNGRTYWDRFAKLDTVGPLAKGTAEQDP